MLRTSNLALVYEAPPPQSVWCFLGFHSWISLEKIKTIRGRRYVCTYNRCDRPGCRRYPRWVMMDARPVRWEDLYLREEDP